MSWISNKLKVAETFLQQIDQQAAESLGKAEAPRSDDLKLDVTSKSSGTVSLKDQLKRKSQESSEYTRKLSSDPNFKTLGRNNSLGNNVTSTSSPTPKPKPKSNTLTDSDWTELLSTPTPAVATGLGVSRKGGSKGGGSAGNRSQKSGNGSLVNKSTVRKSSVPLGGVANGGKKKPSDADESSSSGRSSSVELKSDGKGSGEEGVKLTGEKDEVSKEQELKTVVIGGGGVDAAMSPVKVGVDGVSDRVTGAVRGKPEADVRLVTSVLNDLKRSSSSMSDENSSESGSGSESSSGSESEREREERRKRKEKILAEKAAAKAVEAIKERENMVARLEGEKESLEKILDEREKQQAKEASELQTTMMETMNAVELEKQKHNNTRMEALARLAKLETTNADLARSLATSQKKLEVENDQVAELRQQIESKEVAHEELRKRISDSSDTGTYLNQVAASKGVKFEQEILEAEYSFITDKLVQLQDKVKELEANIEMTRKESEEPTEVEVELKRRLGQLTDHLISKQAQVESLSSEKATILFRIEAVSRLLDENKSTSAASSDLESGTWDLSQTKLKPLFEDKIRSGRKHIGSLVRQLDAIFLAGAVFLRRNPTAKLWSLVYLVCLHLWVIYILMSHSQLSNEARSGAVFSLENMNRTGGR